VSLSVSSSINGRRESRRSVPPQHPPRPGTRRTQPLEATRSQTCVKNYPRCLTVSDNKNDDGDGIDTSPPSITLLAGNPVCQPERASPGENTNACLQMNPKTIDVEPGLTRYMQGCRAARILETHARILAVIVAAGFAPLERASSASHLEEEQVRSAYWLKGASPLASKGPRRTRNGPPAAEPWARPCSNHTLQ